MKNQPVNALNPRRILCLFDYMCNTGFGMVSKNIVRELKKHFGKNIDLDIFAINYFGETFDEDDNVHVCSAQGNDPAGEKFGQVGFMRQLTTKDYDGVFIIQDLNAVTASLKGGSMVDYVWVVRDKKKNSGGKKFKSMFYFPVDCPLLDIQVKGLEFFDKIVTYTEFGKKEVLKTRPELKDKLGIVVHGNNNKEYYPLPEQEIIDFRRAFFGEVEPYSRFIVSNVNRNQPRKDIPNTIFGFIEAKENWPADLPKPLLYLHMNPDDSEGHNLRLMMDQTSLIEREDYLFCPNSIKKEGATDELMNQVYNASDVYLTTTTGEGWGLGITNAMSTKTPVIATNYSSIPEMTDYGKRAWLLESLYPHCSVVGSMIRVQTDLYEVADKIIEVATAARDNTQEYQNKIDAAYKYVLSLDWQIICKQWAKYFHEVFDIPYRN